MHVTALSRPNAHAEGDVCTISPERRLVSGLARNALGGNDAPNIAPRASEESQWLYAGGGGMKARSAFDSLLQLWRIACAAAHLSYSRRMLSCPFTGSPAAPNR